MALTLLCATSSQRWSAAAEIIRKQCESVGIQVFVNAMDTQTIHRRMANGEYDMLLTGWSVAGDPAHVLSALCWDDGDNTFCKVDSQGNLVYNGWNDTGYNNPEYDRLYDRFAREKDRDQRIALGRELAEMVERDRPILVLGWPVRNQACDSSWVEFKSSGVLYTANTLRQILSTVEF
jgi:ABC-type transport system substrate-binding protein